MDQVTQQNAALVEEAAAATDALANQADHLTTLVAAFQLDHAQVREEKQVPFDAVPVTP
jgi:methyl-accepting chemotaxis protein-4 (peptide sensor receptor)